MRCAGGGNDERVVLFSPPAARAATQGVAGNVRPLSSSDFVEDVDVFVFANTTSEQARED